MIQEADKLLSVVGLLLKTAKTEEDLRIGFEKALDPVLSAIGVKTEPKYERLGHQAKTICRGRPDAIHGQVIIEYEAPKAFSSERAVAHAREQLQEYMTAEAQGHKSGSLAALGKLVGVGFDGRQMFFLHYMPASVSAARARAAPEFRQEGPYSFDAESARTFLTHLRALSRLPLTAEHLAQKFGGDSKIAPQTVSAIADAFQNWAGERVKVFYNEWKRLFGIVYGEQFAGKQAEKARALAKLYGVGKTRDFQELLFAVHTYFALLMKFIAAEILTLNESVLTTSFSRQLTHASKEELLSQLRDIEDGGVYARRGITNFLEGDFFRWYLDAMSPRLEGAIREMTRALAEFEPATTAIDPESSRDLLKKLYQYLVPQEVRHDLGEYYTPDWLAELVLDEVGYDGNSLGRVLDPACGSGTFLALAIRRARQFGQMHKEPKLETAKRIVSRIWGFDLNPLAVIAARTNFLFALGDLAHELQSFEIPVYLADSVLWPERFGQMELRPEGESVSIPTSLQVFHVPKIWVQDRGFLMRRAAPLVEQLAKEHYSAEEAVARFKKHGLVFPPHEKIVASFYAQILNLQKEDKNGIWARFLKNAFAPMTAEKFDYVVGNPPWIRWGYLSQEYRNATRQMWKEYGLFSLKGHAARLGGGEKDFSMLFTYAAADYYLAENGKLGFLITQEIYKSKGAGEGFRRFQLGERDHLRVLKAHDLVSVQPFEGASNKTAAIVLRKGQKTKYPVPYTVWQRKHGVGRVPTDLMLVDALPLLEKQQLEATPIGSATGSWQTVSKSQTRLARLAGENAYHARLGARVEPYGVFWLELKQVFANGELLVRNLAEKGERKVPNVEERIEGDLVFPAVRGADIQRWYTSPRIYVLISQDYATRTGYSETEMKRQWPRTYSYLTRFKDTLISRAAYKKYHEEVGNPFYSQYNVSDYTFARYKVVWKRMANDLVAAVISQHKTPFGYKTVIPTDTTSLIATDGEAEAHYLCALLNSKPIREFVRSYSSAGRGFGAPSVMNHLGISKFDKANRCHAELAALSEKIHGAKVKDSGADVAPLEEQVNRVVTRLFALK